ncbi:small integral membrane protein 1 isoform X2 [Callithrix jacchus]
MCGPASPAPARSGLGVSRPRAPPFPIWPRPTSVPLSPRPQPLQDQAPPTAGSSPFPARPRLRLLPAPGPLDKAPGICCTSAHDLPRWKVRANWPWPLPEAPALRQGSQ